MEPIDYVTFFKRQYLSTLIAESIASTKVLKKIKKSSNKYSTSVKNTFNKVSVQIISVNEPQENEHSSNVMPIDQAYFSFKKDI